MRIQMIGGGSWGLALARLLAMNGHDVRLWCREEDGPDELARTRLSPRYLPGIELPPTIDIAPRIDAEAEIAVFAAPSHALRLVADRFRFSPQTIRVNVAKGIENDTLFRMSQVLREVQGPGPVATLSGPSHAEEVARDLPASVVAASEDHAACQKVQAAFMSQAFRVYTSADLIGVELGGSLKNVFAVAAGICDGMGLGDNAKAALITRGLAEMARLGMALGANPLTFAGLSGMGDLIVTCESRHSRNRALGEAIARGEVVEEYLARTVMVAEGVRTARSAHALAQRHAIEMPITREVHRVLFEGGDPRDAVAALMEREAKAEHA